MILRSLIICIVLFLTSFGLSAQPNSTTNKTDENGKKTGLWITYDQNGNLKYKGRFEKGMPVDTFLHYFPSGQIQSLVIHKSPTVAYATLFYDTKLTEILAKGKYVNREKDSVWSSFGAENILVEKGAYKKGKKDGEWLTYYMDGKISGRMNFTNDLKDGDYELYYDNGRLKEESKFEEGKLNGLSIIYDVFGKKILKGIYADGVRDKNWIYYNEKQEVDKVLLYEKGRLTNPEDLDKMLKDETEHKGNVKDVLDFEDLRGRITYE